MKLVREAPAGIPPLSALKIRTRIMISRLDPPRVVELVEYSDGRFGIQEDGVAVAQPWEPGRIEACVRSYCSLAQRIEPQPRRARPR